MNSKAIRKQLLAAVAMVLVAAVALGSSTYAWFVASGDVKAEGMSLQIQGDSGIVIKCDDNDQSVWATVATADMSVSAKLKPTSTTDLAKWYHAQSDESKNAKAQQSKDDYTEVTDDAVNYMLKKTFSIRSATSTAMTGVKLVVKSLTVTPKTSVSENLNRSVRVGIKVGNTAHIFAPLADNKSPIAGGKFVLTAKYISDSTTVDEYVAVDSDTHVFPLTDNQIPGTDAGVKAEIYMWFEGEDGNCMSDNIKASLDDLAVTVEFTTAAASA